MARLLVVDDEPSICWSLEQLGRAAGHDLVTAGTIGEALAILTATETRQRPFDLVLLDVRLPDRDGLQALPELRQHLAEAPVVVMTAYGDLTTAVGAVRQGAYEYLIKPFDLTTVERVIERALESRQLSLQESSSTKESEVTPSLDGLLVGRSVAMQSVFKEVALAAASDAGVNLWGESGTGKELIARAIHHFSRRASGPLVVAHLASLNDSLAESELFGHVRGAFTGAHESRTGLLEQANGGTLFLDEVAEISPALQVKLLRAIEYGEILPVGSSETRRVDFRVISATHQDLRQRVAIGKFRHDLYYRLNTFQIALPALRERPEDISELARHFAALLAQRSGSTSVPRISAATIAELEQRRWSGNVRELRNVIEYAVIQARGNIVLPDHLPPERGVSTADDGVSDSLDAGLRRWAEALWSAHEPPTAVYERLLALVEKPVLEVALAHHSGQVAAAARSLGLHRITVRRKAKALGLLTPPKS